MKSLLLATTALMSLTVAAAAADLPRREMAPAPAGDSLMPTITLAPLPAPMPWTRVWCRLMA